MLFFFLIILLPTRLTRTYTLLPYTTLFRSRLAKLSSSFMGQSFDANIQETPKNGKFLHVLLLQISSDAAEFEPGLPRKAAILVLITAQSYIGATIQRGSR